ncbi:metallophosphoesterase [Deinococcus misasensis]|uniref:metallophosphoesterase n=1 Tax=Deinococcus misasensis TaxID=392413 RepID=UPI00054DF44B|nr:metallophosphoesterase [Deinococcus misasensis]
MSLYVMSDIHGRYANFVQHLKQAWIIDDDLDWMGSEEDLLILLGDYTDRGEHGIEVLELVMRLKKQAPSNVFPLMGNHDLHLLATYHHPNYDSPTACSPRIDHFFRNGGQRRDLERMTPEHAAFLQSLPVMFKFGPFLFMHADSLMYLNFGRNIDAVNAAFKNLLSIPIPEKWDDLIAQFSERKAFLHQPNNARNILSTFGGSRIIHGHTPIYHMTGEKADFYLRVLKDALLYCEGMCINIDGGLADSRPPGILLKL